MPVQSGSVNANNNRGISVPRQETPFQAVPDLSEWQLLALQELTATAPLLVTDDDLMSRRFYRALLADTCGLTVIDTWDPDEALRICKTRPVSMVISCILKPVHMDGLKLVSDLRADRATASIPLLIITATMHTREIALETGADAYLNKPCHPKEILQTIWQLLRSRVL